MNYSHDLFTCHQVHPKINHKWWQNKAANCAGYHYLSNTPHTLPCLVCSTTSVSEVKVR